MTEPHAPFAAARIAGLFLLLLCACGSGPAPVVGPAPQPAVVFADPRLPGLDEGDPSFTSSLRAALADLPAEIVARAHHRGADGAPRYVNRLVFASSPYLQQHATNPVNWYPWGDEAFARARQEHKLVLLSVGYATCHWCHVMKRESFEDEELAAYLNRYFVCIKVDREERPDIDAMYMTALQLLTGNGGWPMTVMLTPEREPFFAATYLPARDGDRPGQTGLFTVLRRLKERHGQAPDKVVAEAARLRAEMVRISEPGAPGAVPEATVLANAARRFAEGFDPVHGGFGGGQKFPRPAVLDLLLRYHRRTGDAEARHIALHTLRQMADGGIHDHLGGGFHRYTTDAAWRVPHFEKMLYDNAQLASVYLDAYQLSGEARFAEVAAGVLDYVAREMTHPGGGFYSATDADSADAEGVLHEGWYFTWTTAELQAVLGDAPASHFAAHYGVTDTGPIGGRSVLHLSRPLSETAAALALPEEALRVELSAARAALRRARDGRPAPLRDAKVLASTTGLMISAMARGGLVLGRADDLTRARRAAAFVLDHMRDGEGRLLRVYAAGNARLLGYLDDHAFVIAGLLDLFEATHERRWLDEAIALQGVLDRHHLDTKAGGYFFTGDDHEELLVRTKPAHDGAEPAGNSVACLNLLRLEQLTGEAAYRTRAEELLAVFAGRLTRAPTSLPALLGAVDHLLDRPRQVLLVAGEDGEGLTAMLDVVRRAYLPNRMLVVTRGERARGELAARIPSLASKRPLRGLATAYVCELGRCELPTTEPVVLARQLASTVPLSPAPAPLPVSRPEPP